MSRKPLPIFAQADFKKADRLERIRMHMLEAEQFVLNDAEEQYYNSLLEAYHNCYLQLQSSEVIKWIRENISGHETWYKANRLMQDMNQLFGSFLDKNKELRRQIAAEKLYYYAAKAEEDENWELAASITEKAAKLEGLDKIGIGEQEDLQLPPITVTSDASVLIPIEEMDFEEIEDEEIGEEDEEWDE